MQNIELSKDPRNWEELTQEEQEQITSWLERCLFPTIAGGSTLAQIHNECWFQMEAPTPYTTWRNMWYPSKHAVQRALEEIDWITSRVITNYENQPLTFYSVETYKTVLAPLPSNIQRTGETIRHYYDWSDADQLRAEIWGAIADRRSLYWKEVPQGVIVTPYNKGVMEYRLYDTKGKIFIEATTTQIYAKEILSYISFGFFPKIPELFRETQKVHITRNKYVSKEEIEAIRTEILATYPKLQVTIAHNNL